MTYCVLACCMRVEDREETISPWLQEEKDAILKWRDEHTGGDERVDLCFV